MNKPNVIFAQVAVLLELFGSLPSAYQLEHVDIQSHHGREKKVECYLGCFKGLDREVAFPSSHFIGQISVTWPQINCKGAWEM